MDDTQIRKTLKSKVTCNHCGWIAPVRTLTAADLLTIVGCVQCPKCGHHNSVTTIGNFSVFKGGSNG